MGLDSLDSISVNKLTLGAGLSVSFQDIDVLDVVFGAKIWSWFR